MSKVQDFFLRRMEESDRQLERQTNRCGKTEERSQCDFRLRERLRGDTAQVVNLDRQQKQTGRQLHRRKKF